MLSCNRSFDGDPSDYAWIYSSPHDFKVFDGKRRKRCCSCKQLINKGNLALEFPRERAARGEVEERIYGDGLKPLCSFWMCERCGEIFLNLSDLGFCFSIDASMEEALKEYQLLSGFKTKTEEVEMKKETSEKPRFWNAKVDDKVYCRRFGVCIITKVEKEIDYAITIEIEGGDLVGYTLDGKYLIGDIEPILFYRDETSNYLTTRPEVLVDWSKVPKGTRIEVCDEEDFGNNVKKSGLVAYTPELNYSFWSRGDNLSHSAIGWKFARLLSKE